MRKKYKQSIHFLIIFIFLFQQVFASYSAYTQGISPASLPLRNKLAVSSFIKDVGEDTHSIRLPLEFFLQIDKNELNSLDAVVKNIEKIRDLILSNYKKLLETGEIPTLEYNEMYKFVKSSCLYITRSSGDKVLYLYNKNSPFIWRISLSNKDKEPADNFFKGFLNLRDRLDEWDIGRFRVEVFYTNDTVKEGIGAQLERLYNAGFDRNGRYAKKASDELFKKPAIQKAVDRLIKNRGGIQEKYAKIIIEDLLSKHIVTLKALDNVSFENISFEGRTDRSLTKILVKKGNTVLKGYIVKTVSYPKYNPTFSGGREIRNSLKASDLGLGPNVIYVDYAKQILIEDYLAYSLRDIMDGDIVLTDKEKVILAQRFAEKLFLMFDMDRENRVTHKFDDFVEHTRIVGRGKDIDVRWIDWGLEGGFQASMREFVLQRYLSHILDSVCLLNSVPAVVSFISTIKKLAGEKGQKELNLWNKMLNVLIEDSKKSRFRKKYAPLLSKAYEIINIKQNASAPLSISVLTVNEIIDKLSIFLGDSYKKDYHHGLRHSLGLLEWAYELAFQINKTGEIDWQVLVSAIFLHDAKVIEENHPEKGAEYAGEVLKKMKFLTERQIEKVKRCIVLHEKRSSEGQKERAEAGIEAQILYDIDQLDAFGIKGIYRYLSIYFIRGKNIEDIKKLIPLDIQARFSSLTFGASRRIGQTEFRYAKLFFDKLRQGEKDEILFAELIKNNLNVPPQNLIEIAKKDIRMKSAFDKRKIHRRRRNLYRLKAYLKKLSLEYKKSPFSKTGHLERPQVKIEDIEITKGRVKVVKVYSGENAGRVNMDLLQKALDKIAKNGLGIFGGIDVISVVDNIREGEAEGKVPYSMVKKEGGKRILLLDVDSFKSDKLLYLVLHHELIEGIMTLIPYKSEALRELTSNYMSVMEALKEGIEDVGDVSNLDQDNRFFEIVKYIKENNIKDRSQIISLLLTHMSAMSYYKKLFSEFGIDRSLIEKVNSAKDRFKSALSVFNEVANALSQKVKKTQNNVNKTVKGLNEIIRKVKMVLSILRLKDLSIIDVLLNQNKYIKLDIDDLETNPVLLEWIKGLLRGKEKSPFIFYSGKGSDIGAFLEENNLKEAKIKGQVDISNIITLIDPVNVRYDGMPEDSLYLALPYAKTTVYLAYEVVLAGGNVKQIDSLAKNTIKNLYDAIFGREVKEDELQQLFKTPWTVLPDITKITGTLNTLKKAMGQIETAA